MEQVREPHREMACSIPRTLDVIGEPWSPLILRDIYIGITRFEQIQQELGISRKVLTERLKWLVENGVLERCAYSERPPRYEYRLITKGLELCDLLLVMVRWGDRWMAGEAGPPVLYRHQACGQISHVELHCALCDQPMHAPDIDVEPGPGTIESSSGTEQGGKNVVGPGPFRVEQAGVAVLRIGRLTVSPDWQGRGVGSRLLDEIENQPALGVDRAALFTGHRSAGNLRLYARHGYREERREKVHERLVLVHLTKPIDLSGVGA